jgi:hypothetical protein
MVKKFNEYLIESKNLILEKGGDIPKDDERTALLLDGTSSAGKSYTLKQIGAKHSYDKDRKDNDYEIIALDDFLGDAEMNDPNDDYNKRRWELEKQSGIDPKILDWAKKNGEFAPMLGTWKKDVAGWKKGREEALKTETDPEKIKEHKEKIAKFEKVLAEAPEGGDHPSFIPGTDPRAWYMAEKYKNSKSKKVVFDDVNPTIRQYLPKGAVKTVLLHADPEKLLDNIKKREKDDARDPSLVFDDYINKYEFTKEKPKEGEGDPGKPVTKAQMESLLKGASKNAGLSQSTVDDEYIKNFIERAGLKDDGTYYMKVRDSYVKENEPVLLNSDKDGKFLETFKKIAKDEENRVAAGKKEVARQESSKSAKKELKTLDDLGTSKMFSGVKPDVAQKIRDAKVTIAMPNGKKKSIKTETLMDFIPIDLSDPEEAAMVKAQSAQYAKINVLRINNKLKELVPFDMWLKRNIELAKDNKDYQARVKAKTLSKMKKKTNESFTYDFKDFISEEINNITFGGNIDELNSINTNMKHIHTFENFVTEAYKNIPYNVKISGEYEIFIDGKTVVTKVAGFERENDDSDSLYLMDNDPLKADHGSFIVKNSDMPKLQKGTVVKATCSKHGMPATLKRIGDL